MKRTAENYAALFTEDTGEQLRIREGVQGYRIKTIRAGDTIEIEGYAIWCTAKQAGEARKQSEKHREAVKAVNLRNQQKKMRRMVNANFGAGDLFITLTYDPERQPADSTAAQRDIRNYLRRLARRRARLGLPELKYIYTTECTTGILGTRYHHHLITNGGISRDEAEAIWKKGNANSRICRTDNTGLTGLAHYMTKRKETQEKARRHGFACSRNLRQPRITTADHKIGPARMARIAEDMQEHGREIIEQLYPGFVCIERPEVRYSPWVTGIYLEVRLIRAK